MQVDIKTISQLRDRTGAGIGDCKSALIEAGDDIEKAIEILRKKGEAKSAKKATRATNEGLASIAREGNKVAVVVLNCETDFVALNEDFVLAVAEFAKKLLADGEAGFKEGAEAKIKNELVIKIGENIQIGECGIMSGGIIGSYMHSNNKVVAVVSLSGGTEELARELAMQVVAMSPKYIKPDDISQAEINKEKEIYREQLLGEGKPENILDKILEGKLNKYYEEVCLMHQDFIKDEDKNISDLLKEAGEDVQIKEFKKFSV